MTVNSVMRKCLVVALLLVVAAAAGCTVNPATGETMLNLIPESQEIAMGKQAAPGFVTQFEGEVPDPTLQAYVQEIGQKMAAVSDRPALPYQYRLVKSKVPNAFALPGGEIFVTAGLMALMENERELAAVLGHETGHCCALHGVQGMQREMGVSVVAEIAARATGNATAGDAAKVVGTFANLKYSRKDEYQADQLGLKYIVKGGYNPWGMVELLTILLNLSDKEPGRLEELMQTHPISSKRIAEAKGMIQKDYASHQQTAADPGKARFMEMRARLLKLVPLK